jgi:hypothetical protein
MAEEKIRNSSLERATLLEGAIEDPNSSTYAENRKKLFGVVC